MIIVTQDGNIAFFDKLVEIYKTFGESITIEAEKINDGYINLGEYATAERANEVLEEIIENIQCKSFVEMNADGVISEVTGGIYRMPES